MPWGVLFDLDGVLVDTFDMWLDMANVAAKEDGVVRRELGPCRCDACDRGSAPPIAMPELPREGRGFQGVRTARRGRGH